jgi:hypothetical protein
MILAALVFYHSISQSSSEWFDWVLPWDAMGSETSVDMRNLNAVPAGKNGFIKALNGHFIESATGKRVRFFGTNVSARAAFPSKPDADKIARRMATLGINIVRLHHLNNGWDSNGGSVWKPGRTYIEIDPAQLDKLDYFVAALKKNGIYVNVNLQVSREYVPELGLPESSRQLKDFGKKIDKIYPKMIELQKDYARQLIDRTNPYTGLKYKDDPAVMVVEINNENSLLGWPGEQPGAGLMQMPEPFREYVVQRWNQWLRKKYTTTEAIRNAWTSKNALTGPSLVSPEIAWTNENQSGGSVIYTELPAQSNETSRGIDIEVKDNRGPDWHMQAHLGGLNLKPNETYTVQFRARSEKPLTFGINARLGKPDWRMLGLGGTVSTTAAWREYSFTFRCGDSEPNATRLSFVVGDMRGKAQIRDVRVRPGTAYLGLPEGESLERGISVPTMDGSPRSRDYTRFLVETEAAYSEEMRRFLRNDLGFIRTNIIDTQISWGGLTSLVREKEMEFADNHAYWNHPNFLGSAWDPKNYRVDRRALVSEMENNRGTLWDLSTYRVLGKPYSVSEYNHPAPSDFQCEMMPLYGTLAAFQDWDIMYTFDWSPTGSGVANDRYDNYFDVARNPAKAAFFPSTAMLFRAERMPKSSVTFAAGTGPGMYDVVYTAGDAFRQSGDLPIYLEGALGLKPGAPIGVTKTGASATNPKLSVTSAKHGKVFVANASAAKVISGFLGGSPFQLDLLQVQFSDFGQNFASLVCTTTDGKDLYVTNKALITLVGRVENKNMGWNGERNTVSDNWGTGPVQAEFIPAVFRIRTNGPRQVYALRPDGSRGAKIKSQYAAETLTFSTSRLTPSLWIEIAKD